jgi:hypothetical protein
LIGSDSIFAKAVRRLNDVEFVSRDVETAGETGALSDAWPSGAMKRHAAFLPAARLAPE